MCVVILMCVFVHVCQGLQALCERAYVSVWGRYAEEVHTHHIRTETAKLLSYWKTL